MPTSHVPPATPAQHRAEIAAYAQTLVGIHEVPAHSNDGPPQLHGVGVHVIQESTGAFRLPWCVSTGQFIWLHVLGSTWANRTAGAYALGEYAAQHGCVIAKPVVGCGVVYHVGAGHYGTVVKVNRLAGTFLAVEGNEADRVALVSRNPRQIRCTFVLRPELHDRKPA